jgi:hypothetical protein
MVGHRRAAPGPKSAAGTGKDRGTRGGTDRERLVRLLDEVEKLDVRPETPPPADRALTANSDKIRRASAAQMLAILSREPAGLIAAVLRVESWPWEAAFLARLDPAMRERVTATLREDFRISGKLASTLRSVLESRLGAEPGPRKPAKGLRQFFARALERWIR